ncbi:sterol desaturase family protein [Flammeovirgaceae bacterium SG7u.111]|nr:sterol desaturase family protein [Flammeovirgaceae bacterium SG7u.132]WPO34354.1 sterol desaturase family protein [Flammeovirgaceae bacterium SG7u.111]
MCINYIWTRVHKMEALSVTKSDVNNSLLTLLINILVAIPGYFLYTKGYIQFTEHHFFIDLLLLLIGFDFSMYFLHYLSHTVKFLKSLHNDHHTHTSFNVFSLYVMNPFESFSFGLLLTVACFLFPVNIYSFLVFLVFNWLYGVISHLNTNSSSQPTVFVNHIFHKTHHTQYDCNYGFYTLLWDKLFGTFAKEGK